MKSRAERNEIYFNWVEGGRYHELELIGADGQAPGLAREDSDLVGYVLRKTNDSYSIRIGGDGTGSLADLRSRRSGRAPFRVKTPC